MTITSVINSAVSGLIASQSALRTISENVANVNTEGFARKTIELQPRVTDGNITGVEVGMVKRVVDEFLSREVLNASAEADLYKVQTELHDRLQSLFGRPDQNSSLPGLVDDVFVSLGALAVDPASSVRRTAALGDLEDLLSEVSRLAGQVQLLRNSADQQIAQDITEINDALRRVSELNPLIAERKLAGVDVTGLEDRRDAAVRDLAALLDIETRAQPSGELHISTRSGLALLNASDFRLQYTSPGTTTTETRFPQITVNRINSNTGIVEVTGTPLDPALQAGALRGLLNMRDGVLFDVATQLGTFAAGVADELNAVHNANAQVPPLNSLAGRNTGLLATDAHNFTGVATFAVLDASQKLVKSIAVDFTAGAISVNGSAPTAIGGTTIGDVVSAVNGALGADGTLSFTGGVMTFQAANPSFGVAIAQDETVPSSRGGRGFSHFFGMNDLVTASVPSHYDTGFTGTDAHGFGAGEQVSFEFVSRDGEILAAHTLTIAGGDFNAILADLNDPANLGNFMTFALDGEGKLTVTPATVFQDALLKVTTDTTGRGGTGVRLSELFGIGDKFVANAANAPAIRSDIKLDPARLSLTKLDLGAVIGGVALTSGDTSGTLAFQALETRAAPFARAGGIPANSSTLSEYGARIISTAAQLARSTSKLSDARGELLDELKIRTSEISGVNLDEELSNLILFQNAFNAAARLVATADELFNTLLDAV